MSLILIAVGAVVVGLLIGGLIGWSATGAAVRRANEEREEEARRKAEQILRDSRDEAENRGKGIIEEARNEARSIKAEAAARAKETENEWRQRQKELERREQNFLKSEEKLASALDKVEKRRAEQDSRAKNLDKREEGLAGEEAKQRQELERVASLTPDDARKELMQRVEEEARYEAAQLRRNIEDTARQEANEVARKLIVKAVFRCAVDHYADSLITTIDLKNDDMKGRIIGREGRNIRAIEAATGVDVIVDDTPNVVMLSSFDGVRREVARVAIERLIQDGRIHPAKIEEYVEQARELINDEIWRAGQEATFRTGITGLHPELVRYLGKLKYRTSYGQNVLAHSIEVAVLSATIASELGLNSKNAKRGGLLHDVGKAADPEMEGSHPETGGILGRKYGENEVVINCIEAHHGDKEQTIEAAIVQVADAISAVRPGARGEALQSYVQRLQQLERIARSFAGVEKCYAISAGRELRVLVQPDQMDDVLTYDLCRQIARRIEDELEYPGTIKVTVIRETRESAMAK